MGITKRGLVIRILSTVLILLIMVGLTTAAYITIWRSEEEHCREALSASAQGISSEIIMRMEDNGNILQLAAGALIEGDSYSSPEDIIDHVNKYLDLTIFSRIDILFPDNTILLYNGDTMKSDGKTASFEEIAARGMHISHRSTDFLTGEEVVYYDVPVIRDGEAIAVLVGVIDCKEMPEFFSTKIYNGEAECLIVDRVNGSIIMDSMLEELTNFYSYSEVETLAGHKNIDLIESVKNRESGFFAYKSPRSGENSYMVYTPIEDSDWHLLVTVREELAFEALVGLRKSLATVAVVECLAVVLFVVLNIISINQLAKSKEQAEHQLHKSNVLIECVTELSSNDNIDRAINNLMAIINRFFDGDRSYIFGIDYEKRTLSNLYESVADGVAKEIEKYQNVPLSSAAYWIDEISRSEIFYIADIEDESVKTTKANRDLSSQNIKSIVAVPLRSGDTVTGFMGVDCPRKHYDDLTLLSSVQFFITEAMERKTTQEDLTRMSYTDTLTRMHNRNRFNRVRDEYHRYPRTRVGVAFFDLDGLKRINDTRGHDAGDRLIISTADNIRSVFSGNSFRIGGDEFAVVVSDISEEDFAAQVDEVRDLMKKDGISIAAGISWRETKVNLKQQLKEADKLMYEEKAEHRRRLAQDSEDQQ
ncbi:MAG: diguanylate cyclase [Clostridia bacterium]|nr:diguanylate cyclase [Clostridia bacterium]